MYHHSGFLGKLHDGQCDDSKAETHHAHLRDGRKDACSASKSVVKCGVDHVYVVIFDARMVAAEKEISFSEQTSECCIDASCKRFKTSSMKVLSLDRSCGISRFP